MKDISILYFHTLDLTFKSAQTIQVIKDYYHLSNLGIDVIVYGSYENEKDYSLIKEYIAGSNLRVIAKKNNKVNRVKLKFHFFLDLFTMKTKKIIITRHHRKLIIAQKLKKYGAKIKIIHEMHEESFPHLFKSRITQSKVQSLLLSSEIDLLMFTNFSQKILFKEEFGLLPRSSIVLPNGVDFKRFQNISMSSNFVITYGGGFNSWKNVDLIFEAMSLLDDKFTLKISGGKGDSKSDTYINNLIEKFKINPKRVNYLGFVDNQDFPERVLDKSHILLLPLGDNIQSRYLTSPMKLFEYMATSIPILAVNFPSISLLANDSIYFSSIDAKDFANTIKKISETKAGNFDSTSMNKIAVKYSYINRSLLFYKEIVNGFF
jgi:glycosyltransferase involved in cell wall biosynthesis